MDRKPLSWLDWVKLYISAPIAFYLCIQHWESRPADENCIKNNDCKGLLRTKLIKTISMAKAKKLAKQMDVTFNELILGLISQSIKVYFKNHGDNSTYISVTMPFTLQTIPKNPADYRYGNSFSSVLLYLNLHEDFHMAVHDAKKKYNFLKQSVLIPGYSMLMWFYGACMPSFWNDHIYRASGRKHSLLLSNVPGFLKPVSMFDGCEARRFISLGSATGSLTTSINLISVNKQA